MEENREKQNETGDAAQPTEPGEGGEISAAPENGLRRGRDPDVRDPDSPMASGAPEETPAVKPEPGKTAPAKPTPELTFPEHHYPQTLQAAGSLLAVAAGGNIASVVATLGKMKPQQVVDLLATQLSPRLPPKQHQRWLRLSHIDRCAMLGNLMSNHCQGYHHGQTDAQSGKNWLADSHEQAITRQQQFRTRQ